MFLSLKRYEWPFLLAAVDRPILGADFLRHHGLVVDLQGHQLLNIADMFVVLEAARGSLLLPRLLHVPGAGLRRRIDFFFLILQFQQLRLVVAVTGGGPVSTPFSLHPWACSTSWDTLVFTYLHSSLN